MLVTLTVSALLLAADTRVARDADETAQTTEWLTATDGDWNDYSKWSGDAPCHHDIASLKSYTDDAGDVIEYTVELSPEVHPVGTILLEAGAVLHIPENAVLDFNNDEDTLCKAHTAAPSVSPSMSPTTVAPTGSPSSSPTAAPTSSAPTAAPTSSEPTTKPSQAPTIPGAIVEPPSPAPTALFVPDDAVVGSVIVQEVTIVDTKTVDGVETVSKADTKNTATAAAAAGDLQGNLAAYKTALTDAKTSKESAQELVDSITADLKAAADADKPGLQISLTSAEGEVAKADASITALETAITAAQGDLIVATATLCADGQLPPAEQSCPTENEVATARAQTLAALTAKIEALESQINQMQSELESCKNANGDCTQINSAVEDLKVEKRVADVEKNEAQAEVTAGQSRQKAADNDNTEDESSGGGGGGMIPIIAGVVAVLVIGGVAALMIKGGGGGGGGSGSEQEIRHFDNPLYDESQMAAASFSAPPPNDGYLDVEAGGEGLYDEPIIGSAGDEGGFSGFQDEDGGDGFEEEPAYAEPEIEPAYDDVEGFGEEDTGNTDDDSDDE